LSKFLDIKIPDLGDFDNVEVIEVLVKIGDSIEENDNLISLETDKASIDVPATHAGIISSIYVSVGDKVSLGDLILSIKEVDNKSGKTKKTKNKSINKNLKSATHTTDLLVLGAGPGGYTAAFRAADLGMKVTLVERWPVLGGVCLNVGCIPSKALLHAAKVIDDAAAMKDHGIKFTKPQIDPKALGAWKDSIIKRLTSGLEQLASQRKVNILQGDGSFQSSNRIVLDNKDTIDFKQCIIAVGSESASLPNLPIDDRIMDSSMALELNSIPDSLLVVGGGIIGLEMACVYSALGTKVSIVELTETLMPGTDSDLVLPFYKIVKKRYENIYLKTRVSKIESLKAGIKVRFEREEGSTSEVFDCILIAIGRRSNAFGIGLKDAGIDLDEQGIVKVDKQMKTNKSHIFAIGDITGNPMLAHKATHQAKVAAEVAAGKKSAFDVRVIPSVAYTDPEIAWVGLTENEAKESNIAYEKTKFPWSASGRSLANSRDEGFTKLLFDKETGRVIGGGIVGSCAGDLISEIALAIEMGADAADIGMTIHPHPTLSETIAFAAEAQEGVLTDLYMPKK
jgi:dihydrolipoamide dehydrogenase|tara:strand:- start:15109 stop:16809 length:1701 start_codon:yes stop_codon:yes gene_type:complete